jgi:hypothetical protein
MSNEPLAQISCVAMHLDEAVVTLDSNVGMFALDEVIVAE